ncbi:hypothetical protein D3C84_664710 [compost metagenome]
MDFRTSLLALKDESYKASLVRGNKEMFKHFIESSVEAGGVVCFLHNHRELFDEFKDEYDFHNLPFLVAYLDSVKYHNPFIYKEKENVPVFTHGFLIKDENVYFSVPPRPSTHRPIVLENKQSVNFPYLSRIPMKVELCVDDVCIAEDIHRMRNISLTYDSYTSYPVPIHHVLKYHDRFLS